MHLTLALCAFTICLASPPLTTAAFPRPTDRMAADVTNVLGTIRQRWCRLNLYASDPNELYQALQQPVALGAQDIIAAEHHRPWLKRELERAGWFVVALNATAKDIVDEIMQALALDTFPCENVAWPCGQFGPNSPAYMISMKRWRHPPLLDINVSRRDREIWCVSDAPLEVRACVELLAFRYLDNLVAYTGPKAAAGETGTDLERWNRHVRDRAQWQASVQSIV